MPSRKRFSRPRGHLRKRRSSIPAVENLEQRLVLSLGSPSITIPIQVTPLDSVSPITSVTSSVSAQKVATPTSAAQVVVYNSVR